MQMSILSNARQLISFMKVMRVSRKSFVISIVLSFFAVIFNVISIRLLMFLLRGMITRDFLFVGEIRGFSDLVALAPKAFQSSAVLFALLLTVFFVFTMAKIIFQYISSVSDPESPRTYFFKVFVLWKTFF